MFYQNHNSIGQNYFEHIRYQNINFSLHMHRHPEFVFVRSGRLIIEMNGRTEEAMQDDFVLIPSNCAHSYATPEHSETDVCVFSEDIVPVFSKEMRAKKVKKTVFTCRKPVRDFICGELLDIDEHDNFLMLKSVLYAMLSEYLTQVPFEEMEKKNEMIVDQLIHYVSKNFTENISLKSAAEALGYEEHYLSRCFHNLVPMHFSKYVNLFRVDEANELLHKSELSISEIAMKSGFQSLRTFNRVFLELTGKSPKSYRKEQEQLKSVVWQLPTVL